MIARLHCDGALLRELWETDATVTEIGQRIGASRTWVSAQARKLGLPPRAVSSGALPGAKIEHAYRIGTSIEDIVARLKPQFPTLSTSTVATLLRSRGVPIRGRITMTPESIAECVRLARLGWNQAKIAAKLGLSERQVGVRCRRILGPMQRGRRSVVDMGWAKRLRSQGLLWREVAAEMGVSLRALHWARRSKGAA